MQKYNNITEDILSIYFANDINGICLQNTLKQRFQFAYVLGLCRLQAL